jgi:thiamine biosynthesis lipoprotein ApbE
MTELLEEWGLERALVHGGFSSVCALESSAGCEGWPLTLRDPGAPSRLLARLSMRQMAVSASGLQKGAHIVDPRNGDAVRGRLAAWVVVPRPCTAGADAPADGRPRAAAAAVTDALATAFMLLSTEAIAALCERSSGLEAWVLQESPAGEMRDPELRHFGANREL